MLPVSSEATEKRQLFLETIFDDLEGYLCLCTLKPHTRTFHEEFFQWPSQKAVAMDFIQKWAMSHNVYFCPTLFDKPKRVKENVTSSWVAWADLDSCRPEVLRAKATFVIESSPNRYQALWKFEEAIAAFDAEDISRRVAYTHADEGADKSGWDLTQLLRVPFCINHKYTAGAISGPLVKIVEVNQISYSQQDLLDLYPQVEAFDALEVEMPTAESLDETADELLESFKFRLQPMVFMLYGEVPTTDWSKSLWQLEMFLAEAGMSREQIFTVAREAKCNKYKRDGVHERQLWKEVCRAYAKVESLNVQLTSGEMPSLLTDAEREIAQEEKTFVEDYIEWAKSIGDAAPQYHQAGAFIILSSLAAGPIKFPTSFGTIVPNLWFMILADTTLTRKSTAMDLAMDLLVEVDPDAMMATDGSIEGLFATLQYRPGRPSVFLRDEFSGLLEAMTKKDYYAGMAETLTKLYDGKYQKRILRRDTIEVKDPVLILFAGGIRSRILELLQYEHVASGFMPRFVFITAESDLARVKPLGPPTEKSQEGRAAILERMAEYHTYYTQPTPMTINGKTVMAPADWRAEMTPEAWIRYNDLETSMMEAALKSRTPELMTPMFDRLSKSGLKAALLLASLRMEPKLVIQEKDLLKAFSYVEQWREYALQIVQNIGSTSSERKTQLCLRAIVSKPGILRTQLMQSYHLTARDAEQILMTLEQRGQISRVKSGRTERLYPTSVSVH